MRGLPVSETKGEVMMLVWGLVAIAVMAVLALVMITAAVWREGEDADGEGKDGC